MPVLQVHESLLASTRNHSWSRKPEASLKRIINPAQARFMHRPSLYLDKQGLKQSLNPHAVTSKHQIGPRPGG
jgi:hypothetical protein